MVKLGFGKVVTTAIRESMGRFATNVTKQVAGIVLMPCEESYRNSTILHLNPHECMLVGIFFVLLFFGSSGATPVFFLILYYAG